MRISAGYQATAALSLSVVNHITGVTGVAAGDFIRFAKVGKRL